MVSLMITNEFYFTFNFAKSQTADALEAVNEKRNGTKHANVKTEIAVHGSDDEKDLTSTPLYRDVDQKQTMLMRW